MNKYEIMFIVKTTIEEEAVKKVIADSKKIITDLKGEILEEKDMGQRKLAYPINKEINGFYYVMQVNANGEIVAEFDRKSKINENIIRHLVIKLDEE